MTTEQIKIMELEKKVYTLIEVVAWLMDNTREEEGEHQEIQNKILVLKEVETEN